MSLFFNAFCSVILVTAAYNFREKIIDRLNLFIDKPSDENLLAFNKERIDILNDSLIIEEHNKTLNILFLGNSISRHETMTVDGFKGGEPRGMAATDVDKDYVHRLVRMISSRDTVNVRYSVVAIAEFERTFKLKAFDWDAHLNGAVVANPDILIVQIGENVSSKDLTRYRKLFVNEYSDLLNRYPKSRRIITLPFWFDSQKCDAITEVALLTRSRLADLSHLGHRNSDPRNFAKFYNRYRIYSVGEHPSDYGFEQIAKAILCEIN